MGYLAFSALHRPGCVYNSVQQMVPVYWGVDVDYLLLHLALCSSMQRVYAYFRGRGPNAQLRAEAAAAAAAEGSNPV